MTVKNIFYIIHILERIINDPVHGKDTIIIAPQVPELERWGGIYYMNEGYYRVADILRQTSPTCQGYSIK